MSEEQAEYNVEPTPDKTLDELAAMLDEGIGEDIVDDSIVDEGITLTLEEGPKEEEEEGPKEEEEEGPKEEEEEGPKEEEEEGPKEEEEEGPIVERIRYGNGTYYVKAVGDLPIVHRTDYHEDGSQSEYYYLELTEQQFADLIGEGKYVRNPTPSPSPTRRGE